MRARPRPSSRRTSLRLAARGLLYRAGFVCWAGSILAALLSGLMLLSAAVPRGAVVLPLDDAYIHLQYGWQAAQGHFLQYNTGDAPTSGATSLLYMMIVASGFLLGVTREAMPAVVATAGIACFSLASALLVDAARRMASILGLPAHVAALLAAIWFAGSGWMAWAFLSGMETGYLVLFVVGTFWALVRRRPGLASVFASLAALTRPEAVGLGLVVLIASTVAPMPGARPTARRLLQASLPVLAAFVSPVVNLHVTGSLSPTGLLAKSWITNQPYDPRVILLSTAATLRELVLGLMGGVSSDGRWHVFPCLQLLAGAGVFVSWRDREVRRAAAALALWGVGLLGITATLQTATWHHYRYQMPAYPALVLAGAMGAVALVYRVRGALAGYARVALVLAALAWSCYSLTDFWSAYRLDVGTAAGMQLELSEWIGSHTPTDARVAVHDVGAVRYVGERYTIDVVGLTTEGMVEASRGGPGATYEALRRARPDHYAVYPTIAPPFHGISSAPYLLGEELYRISLPRYSPYTSAADTQVVTRPSWSDAGLADRPHQSDIVDGMRPLVLVDAINVADVVDEREHSYAWWSRRGFRGFVSEVWHLPYRQAQGTVLTDGGRVFDGGQSFAARTPNSRPVIIVGRFHQLTDAVMDVQVNDVPAGEWRLPAIPGEWQESAFEIPATMVAGDVTRVALAVRPDAHEDTRVGLYYLWVFQGDPIVESATPTESVDARFNRVAALRGYDLASDECLPGDVVEFALYLRSLDRPRGEWRIFVHLIDPRNDTADGILSQWDAAPRAGTYPFWVWRADEIVRIPVQLAIPDDAAAGDYALLVGLYDGRTGERAPITDAPDFGSSRLHVATIRVGP